jgi:hypothetical protein
MREALLSRSIDASEAAHRERAVPNPFHFAVSARRGCRVDSQRDCIARRKTVRAEHFERRFKPIAALVRRDARAGRGCREGPRRKNFRPLEQTCQKTPRDNFAGTISLHRFFSHDRKTDTSDSCSLHIGMRIQTTRTLSIGSVRSSKRGRSRENLKIDRFIP